MSSLVSVIVLSSLSYADPACGELRYAFGLDSAAAQLQARGMSVSYEGSGMVGEFLYRLTAGALPADDAARQVIVACGAQCTDYEVVVRAPTDVVIRHSSAPPTVLDQPVSLAPGERTLADLAAELEAAGVSFDVRPPLTRVWINTEPSRRVVVPRHAGPIALREMLVSLEVVPRWPPRAGHVGPDEHVRWLATTAGGLLQVLTLTIVDLHPYPIDTMDTVEASSLADLVRTTGRVIEQMPISAQREVDAAVNADLLARVLAAEARPVCAP